MGVFRLGNEIRQRWEEEDEKLMEKYAEMEAKYQAKAGERQRRAVEEEAKRRAGEEQRAREEQEGRRMEEEEKRKGAKEKLKHEKCLWQRHFKCQTV